MRARGPRSSLIISFFVKRMSGEFVDDLAEFLSNQSSRLFEPKPQSAEIAQNRFQKSGNPRVLKLAMKILAEHHRYLQDWE